MKILPAFFENTKYKVLGHKVKFMSKRVVHTVTVIPLKREEQENFTFYHIIDLYGYTMCIYLLLGTPTRLKV